MEHVFGFKRAKIAVLDKEGKAIASQTHVLEGDGKGGTVSAKISGLEALTSTISASDGAYYTAASGVGSPKLEMEVVELTNEQKRDILGHVYENGILKIGKQSRPPYVAVMLESEDKDGKPVYIALLKGKLTADGVELQTGEADKAKEGQTVSLSGTFETTGKQGHAYFAARSTNEGFTLEAFEGEVFPEGGVEPVDPDPAG